MPGECQLKVWSWWWLSEDICCHAVSFTLNSTKGFLFFIFDLMFDFLIFPLWHQSCILYSFLFLIFLYIYFHSVWLLILLFLLSYYVQTHRLNLKALQLAKEVKWPLYQNLAVAPSAEMVNYFDLWDSVYLTILSWSIFSQELLCVMFDRLSWSSDHSWISIEKENINNFLCVCIGHSQKGVPVCSCAPTI